MLSLGVLIPTRNCASLLPAHLESVRGWLDLVEEVVVVDSFSKDDTLSIIKSELCHPRLQILSHPPGLYESWNHGIRNLRSKYTYIATVGDSITRAGLEKLFLINERFESDAVASKPEFLNSAGQPQPDTHWPIDDLIVRLRITSPILLSKAEQFFFGLTNTGGALLGSSASNLYRTDTLQKLPFPTDYGTVGDAAWGIVNSWKIRLALTPEKFSTFLHHSKAYSLAKPSVNPIPMRLFRAAQLALREELIKNPLRQAELSELRFSELEPAIEGYLLQQQRLESCRDRGIPWILQPAAWTARWRRSVYEDRIETIKAEVAKKFCRDRDLNG